MLRPDDMDRITDALHEAGEILRRIAAGRFEVRRKAEGSLVTEADLAVDRMLKTRLLRRGEGWLSEEGEPSGERFELRRVWVVDPLDGTREFVAGIPEWCVSVALVEDGVPVAGGIFNPSSDEMVTGAVGSGVSLNGRPAAPAPAATLESATVVVSRSEFERGEWVRFERAGLRVRPVGSIAYKMGLVAAGLAHATCTLGSRSEWDVAAGTALVTAAGGVVRTIAGDERRFNRPDLRVPALVASAPGLAEEMRRFLLAH